MSVKTSDLDTDGALPMTATGTEKLFAVMGRRPDVEASGGPLMYSPIEADSEGRLLVSAVSGTAIADDGTVLQLGSLAETLAYNSDGTLNYVQVTYGGSNYRQTFTYTSGNVTGISAWVKQ